MKLQVTLGFVENGVERRQLRSLIGWCQQFAKAGAWGSIRSYSCWVRSTPSGPAVAIRVELFSQLGCPDPLASLTYRKFTALCEQYAVGRGIKVSGGDVRAVELTTDFVSDLLATPVIEPPHGRTDDDESSHA
jgi:hypothetical protein